MKRILYLLIIAHVLVPFSAFSKAFDTLDGPRPPLIPELLATFDHYSKFVSGPMPAVVTRQEWNSRPAPFPHGYLHNIDGILIHHSGFELFETENPFEKIHKLQTWGTEERDWSDVPYHFIIDAQGNIFQGRSPQFKPDSNTNFDTDGFMNLMLWGNFEEQRVPEAQLRSLTLLIAALEQMYDIEGAQLLGHQDVADTACPGRDLERYIADGTLSNWVHELHHGREPDITLGPALRFGPFDYSPSPGDAPEDREF